MTGNAILWADNVGGDIAVNEVDIFTPRVWNEFLYQYGTTTLSGTSMTTPGTIAGEDGSELYVFVSTFRGSSLDPDVVTLSGAGQVWEEVTLPNGYWSNSGTTRRRVQLFRADAVTANGALTIGFTNVPSRVQIFAVKVYNSTSGPTQIVDEIESMTVNFPQDVTVSAKAQTSSMLAFIVTNVADNEDGILMEDIGWKKLKSIKASTAPTCMHYLGSFPSDGVNQLTPSWITSKGTSASAYFVVLEIAYGVPSAGAPPLYGFGGVLRVLTGTLSIMTTGGLVQVYP